MQDKPSPCKYGHNLGRNKWGQCLECNRIKAKIRWDEGMGREFQQKKEEHEKMIQALMLQRNMSRRMLLRQLVAEEYRRENPDAQR